MKFSVRLLSLLLSAALLFSLAACGNGSDETSDDKIDVSDGYVLKYGDVTFDEYDYMYFASLIKDYMLYYWQSYMYYYTGNQYDEATLLAMDYSADGQTFGDFLDEYILDFAKQVVIIEKLCNDAGLSITDEDSLQKISDHMSDLEYAYGGEDLFDIELTKMGISREAIERYDRFATLYDIFVEYRYGDNGVAPIPESEITDYFYDNYIKFDYVSFGYVDSESSSYFKLDYSEEEIKDYFYTNYVKVAHVLYKTGEAGVELDPDTGAYTTKITPYDDEKLAEVTAKANAAFDAVSSGEKTIYEYSDENEDGNMEYVFTYGDMVSAFEEAAFDMQPGDVRLVETEYGLHVVQKLTLQDTDLFGRAGDDGTVYGNMSEDIIIEMSQKALKEAAESLYNGLKDGTITEFPDMDGYSTYERFDAMVVDPSTSDYSRIISGLGESDLDIITVSGDAVYVVRKLELTLSDLTSDIYKSIEDTFINEAIVEYVESFYDDVEVNTDTLNKFDIAKIPALDDEFYQ